MKSKMLTFLNTYKFSAFMGVLLVLIGGILFACFANGVVIDGEKPAWSPFLLYIFFIWPVFCALHGVLSCVFLKKVCIPGLVMSATACFTFLIVDTNFAKADFWAQAVWPGITFLLSVVAALFTKFILWIIREIKDVYS